MSLQPGTRLGPYEVLSQLGAGGMGEVYRARDTRLERVVAIKVLPGNMAKDPDALARFEREAKAVAALSHPHVLAIFDFGNEDGTCFAAMELLEGESLRVRLTGGPLPPRKAVEYALQICHGLGAAHDKGIVHRDLKPENLFITNDNRIKILDFGLVKLTPRRADHERETMDLQTPGGEPTTPGTVMGTVGYMSPEQVRGEEVDQRSDIFSFGSVLYEMLSGRRAFKADSAVETMSAILKQEPAELEESTRNVPPGLERVVRHCLEKQREARFQSARDLAFQLETLSGVSSTSASSAHTAALASRRARPWPALAIGLGLLAAAALGFLAAGWRSGARAPVYRQLTFQRGTVSAARFAPDGQTIVYSAAWNGGPLEVRSTRSDSPESRSLELPQAGLLALSSSGELAVALGCEFALGACRGTLARVPLSGGAPRALLEQVSEADWAPDGKQLAVVVTASGRSRLEFPPGKLLYEAPGAISHLRFSPKGDLIAFIDRPTRGDDGGAIAVVDLHGRRRVLSEGWGSASGLAWTPSGRELWFTAAESGRIQPLRAVDLAGRQRIVLQAPARLILQDISRTGEVLLARESARGAMLCLPPDATAERDLTWFDWSTSAHLSRDGKSVLFCERGEGTQGAQTVYLRGTDGSAAVKLGDGRPLALSSDGAWALALGASQKLVLLPTGVGAPRELSLGDITRILRASWFPRSNRLLILGTEADRSRHGYVFDVATGALRALPHQGASLDFSGNPVAPDERSFAASGADGKVWLYPLEEGSPRALEGLPAGVVPIQWSLDGKFLFVSQRESFPTRVYRVDLEKGTSELWKTIQPGDATGIVRVPSIEITPDGRSYVYTLSQRLSELYLADGLQQR